MYEFVNLNERGTQSISSSIQTLFNGVNLDNLLTDETGTFRTLTVSGRSNINNRLNTLQIPGRHGLLEQEEYTTDARDITVKYELTDQTNEGFRKRYNRLNSLLQGSKKVLQFSDENAIFYATLSINEVPEEDSNSLVASLTFLCSDPYKYGPEYTATFPGDAITLHVDGTENTKPVFEIDVLQDITHLDLIRGDGEYMRIGSPGQADQEPFDRTTLVMHDSCGTTTGWGTATAADNGHIAGNMISSNGAFMAETFGATITPYGWQGPSIKKSFSEPLTNFQLDVLVENINAANQTGMIEIYLLDANNTIVAKIGLEDVWNSLAKIQTKMQLGEIGNREQYYREADRASAWNNFDGILRLYRDDYSGEKRIRPYFALIRLDGTHDWQSAAYYYKDVEGKYQTPVTQIQLAIRKWPATAETTMRIKDIKAWRFNTQKGIPYIAKAGDKVIIDCKTENILINGEVRKDLKDFGASFFRLQPGENQLFQYPEGALSTSVKWRPAYK